MYSWGSQKNFKYILAHLSSSCQKWQIVNLSSQASSFWSTFSASGWLLLLSWILFHTEGTLVPTEDVLLQLGEAANQR